MKGGEEKAAGIRPFSWFDASRDVRDAGRT
jgi:hypothetical protein